MIKISNHTDVELAEPSQSWLNSLQRKYDKTEKVKNDNRVLLNFRLEISWCPICLPYLYKTRLSYFWVGP